jgi:hypothetical protein
MTNCAFPKIKCYLCGSRQQLLVEELTNDKGIVVDKNFICINCAGGAEKVFKAFNGIFEKEQK